MNNLVSFEDEVSHVAVNSPSLDISSSIRVSLDDNCIKPSSSESLDSMIDRGVDAPPFYNTDALIQTPNVRRKYNIQPREDEGRETLPPYSSEISLENVFSRKVELEGAIHRASDRNWYRVHVTLQGTALTFRKFKSSRYFSVWSTECGRSDVAAAGKKGDYLKSYNLQHADVGIAADYFKYVLYSHYPNHSNLLDNMTDRRCRKRYVIRVRAETDQFLLSCHKIETFVHWLQALVAAIDIAPPLDTRSLPRDFSIPRTRLRRRTCSTTISDIDGNAALNREQYEILRREYPGFIDGPIPENAESPSPIVPRPSTSSSHIAPSHIQMRPSSPNGFTLASTPAERLSSLPQSATALSPLSSSATLSTSSISIFGSEPHPSISPEGKWRPEHTWSANCDMMYFRRCMAILTSRSPRKTNIVIMKGKQWVVDWATGKLTRKDPPDYGEIVWEKPAQPGKQRCENTGGVRVALG